MAVEYSVDVCKKLQEQFHAARLHRPMRISRYDPGIELSYNMTGVGGGATARVRLLVETFVGGGFAGQVYRVKLLALEAGDGLIDGLEVGRTYAVKILIPPSSFSRLFRNLLYWIGFQGPFQLQTNPAAARAAALWQKLIRRAAKVRFGNENAVVDVYATFVDPALGSCGELSEWIDGRTWRLEVDDRLDLLKRWRRGRAADPQKLGSPEYRAKRQFMTDFVKLLHDMGAYELARQYEWSTCKSQPNCLKRRETEGSPAQGLVAVDFRAGLALLPFLPMSPGDLKLIAKGLARGSVVQFDRGDMSKLQAFVRAHDEEFVDLHHVLEELKTVEKIYRASVPDITHNHIRLLHSRTLWSTILDSAVTGWKVRNLVDQPHEQSLRKSKLLTLIFLVIGAIPFLGKLIRRIWTRPDWRQHYGQMLTSCDYLKRAVHARIAEKVIVWHRDGRVDDKRAPKVAESFWRFLCHLPLSMLPAGLHRFLTDWRYAKDRLAYFLIRPARLYFNVQLREQWLRDMVTEGRKKHILTDEDAQTILSQIKQPYIQKYLKCLAVHVCTLPVTQVVSVTVALWYKVANNLTWAQAWGEMLLILAFFQVIPLSPGSLVRGLYAVGMAIRDRSLKDYNIAVFLSFFKYIGYLAFPIQMTYHYPALARFMAAHWATEAVHIVPVFGEHGALLEHWVFCLFYNWPLTIRRRMRKRAELRALMKPRYWHIGLCALAATAVFGLVDHIYFENVGSLPRLRDIWWLMVLLPAACGAFVTLGCRGASLCKRFVSATVCGIAAALLHAVASSTTDYANALSAALFLRRCIYAMFTFALFSTIGAILAELKLPDPDLR